LQTPITVAAKKQTVESTDESYIGNSAAGESLPKYLEKLQQA